MFFWPHRDKAIFLNSAQLKIPKLADVCSTDEVARLEEMRARLPAGSTCQEFGLDERRVGFVRWLITHGKLRENM
jgi:hypothetical protein